ncbi:MAG TPA: pyridoxamine 5'-phosphate oxidase family protein [Steroidobacteraceae bacterium]|nr:pyridoxamine 5'-phosphate oxidase family protein [Steroidobacteraceae bacterium]
MLHSTARDLRTLLAEQRVASIAVLAGGLPCVGLLPFAVPPDHAGLLVHASRLARHSQGLGAGARVSVLVHESDAPGKDALQLRRATFECVVHPLERASPAWEAAREIYLRRFPDAQITFSLADFTLHRLEFTQGLYVAGFGKAIALPPGDLARLANG